jgi:hypothetical protein
LRRPHSPRAPLLAAAKTQEVVLLFLSGTREGEVREEPSGFATPRWSPSRFSLIFLQNKKGASKPPLDLQHASSFLLFIFIYVVVVI